MSALLVCSDLDRTLIPNGKQTESTNAREDFSRFVLKSDIQLCYVTGRDLNRIEEAIQTYHLPLPNYVIANVGATIYEAQTNTWCHWTKWDEHIGKYWQHKQNHDLSTLFSDLGSLQKQPHDQQSAYKLSYYVPLAANHKKLIAEMQTRVEATQLNTNFIWSIDEYNDIGLLDVLPAGASKRKAIEFMMQEKSFDLTNTLFAGDSGNDLDVLVSPILSILVANATDEIKQTALLTLEKADLVQTLYISKDCYSAGVLEGIQHFFPKFKRGYMRP